MPQCLRCGNQTHFRNSQLVSGLPGVPGLTGLFEGGQLKTLEPQGIDGIAVNEAWQRPENYMDTCVLCGSNRISW